MIFTNGDGPLQKQFSADEFCEDAMNITSFNLNASAMFAVNVNIMLNISDI